MAPVCAWECQLDDANMIHAREELMAIARVWIPLSLTYTIAVIYMVKLLAP